MLLLVVREHPETTSSLWRVRREPRGQSVVSFSAVFKREFKRDSFSRRDRDGTVRAQLPEDGIRRRRGAEGDDARGQGGVRAMVAREFEEARARRGVSSANETALHETTATNASRGATIRE